MKIELTASPEELTDEDKARKLLKSLGELVEPIEDILEKALPQKEQVLKYPVLRELQKQTEDAYAKRVAWMLKDVGKVLDRGFAKSENAEPIQDFTKPIADKDGEKYEKVKAELAQYGYTDSDFEEGGVLYGWSVNQLIDLARGKKEQERGE